MPEILRQWARDRGDPVHRDIKPENILLHDGRPVVADFGIALAVSAAAGGRMTETGLSLGTPHYMSPEQATPGALQFRIWMKRPESVTT